MIKIDDLSEVAAPLVETMFEIMRLIVLDENGEVRATDSQIGLIGGLVTIWCKGQDDPDASIRFFIAGLKEHLQMLGGKS